MRKAEISAPTEVSVWFVLLQDSKEFGGHRALCPYRVIRDAIVKIQYWNDMQLENLEKCSAPNGKGISCWGARLLKKS
jgi:hypothetical protein